MGKVYRHEYVLKNGELMEHLSFRFDGTLEDAKRRVKCDVDACRLDGETVEVLDDLTYLWTHAYRPHEQIKYAFREHMWELD